MLQNQDIQRFSKLLSGFAEKMTLCQQLAEALIETGQTWRYSSDFLMAFFGTDYGRQRERVRGDCYASIALARKVRRAAPCVDAIRATAHVQEILKSCIACPAANQANLAAGRPFTCLARQRTQTMAPNGFRFAVDKEGRIFERR